MGAGRRALYYVAGDGRLELDPMHVDGTFGASRSLAEGTDFLINDRFESYSVSPDGARLLMIRRDDGSAPRQRNVILNWSGGSDRR